MPRIIFYHTICCLTFLTACSSKIVLPKYYINPPEQFDIALSKPIKIDSVDLVLLDWAIFEETNRHRQRLGVKKLRFNRMLQKAAELHTEEMVELNYFSHTSPVLENGTLMQRIRRFGIRNGIAGENIAIHPLMKTQEVVFNKRVASVQTTTRYAWRNEGVEYTYEEFAVDLVNRWLNSPPHRFNILNRQFRFLGISNTLTRYNARAVFYVTQNFSSHDY